MPLIKFKALILYRAYELSSITGKFGLSNNGNDLQNTGNNNTTANIITDFSSDSTYKPFIYYVPSGQYRYTELCSQRPFNTVDISVWYRVKTGELVPFLLTAGGNLTLKILFQKKSTLPFTSKRII
jgi:hypothetical protein